MRNKDREFAKTLYFTEYYEELESWEEDTASALYEIREVRQYLKGRGEGR